MKSAHYFCGNPIFSSRGNKQAYVMGFRVVSLISAAWFNVH